MQNPVEREVPVAEVFDGLAAGAALNRNSPSRWLPASRVSVIIRHWIALFGWTSRLRLVKAP